MITEKGNIVNPSVQSQHPIYKFLFPNQPVEGDKEPSIPWFGSDPPAWETTRSSTSLLLRPSSPLLPSPSLDGKRLPLIQHWSFVYSWRDIWYQQFPLQKCLLNPMKQLSKGETVLQTQPGHLQALNRAWEQFSQQRSGFPKQFVMIRGESHDPVYTQIPNGLSGALAAEAKDVDTLESHPGHPHLLLQRTATTAW